MEAGRHIDREDRPGEVQHLDRAGAQLRQHVGVATELAVGKQLQVEAPARFPADHFRGLAQPHVHRMCCHLVVGVFEFEFGGVAAPGQNAKRRDTACGRRGDAHKGAAGNLAHGRVLVRCVSAAASAGCSALGLGPITHHSTFRI
jgi:hypothetical protein